MSKFSDKDQGLLEAVAYAVGELATHGSLEANAHMARSFKLAYAMGELERKYGTPPEDATKKGDLH